MDDSFDRRVADKRHRIEVSQRLAAIETTQRLYHDEIKAITERLHQDILAVNEQVKTLNRVVFGGESPGILENIRSIMAKFWLVSTVGFGAIGFLLKLFSPTVNKMAMKIVGEDPVSQFKYQSTKRQMKAWDAKQRRWIYFIEFKPVGVVDRDDR